MPGLGKLAGVAVAIVLALAGTARADAPALMRLISDYEAWSLSDDPFDASREGDRAALERLPDPSPAADARRRAALVAFRARLQALPASGGDATDRLNRDFLGWTLDRRIASLDFDEARMPFNSDGGFDQTLSYLREERSDEEVKPVDLVAILETVTDDAVDAGGTARLDGSATAVVPGRRLALKRAFGNLIGNAVKYGHRAETNIADGQSEVRITITDEGPGISAEDQKRALQPFVRLEPSRNTETGGFGLGLSIADAVIRCHGGRLELRNGERSGLVVTVILPKGGPAQA